MSKLFSESLRLQGALKEIRDIHRDHAEGHYRTAEILHDFWIEERYTGLNFSSWREFTEQAVLPISRYQMDQYVKLYENLRYYQYKKAEALELLKLASVHAINRQLNKSDKKLKPSTLCKNHREEMKLHPQINFSPDPSEMKEIVAILESYGLSYSDTGRRSGATEAMIAALRKAGPKTRQVKSA